MSEFYLGKGSAIPNIDELKLFLYGKVSGIPTAKSIPLCHAYGRLLHVEPAASGFLGEASCPGYCIPNDVNDKNNNVFPALDLTHKKIVVSHTPQGKRKPIDLKVKLHYLRFNIENISRYSKDGILSQDVSLCRVPTTVEVEMKGFVPEQKKRLRVQQKCSAAGSGLSKKDFKLIKHLLS